MTSTTHPVEREELMAYLDGELRPPRNLEVAAHLDACADCRSFAAEMEAISTQIRDWHVEPGSDTVIASIQTAVTDTATRPGFVKGGRSHRYLSRGWALGLAASVALVILVVFYFTGTGVMHTRVSPPPSPSSAQSDSFLSPMPAAPPTPRAERMGPGDDAWGKARGGNVFLSRGTTITDTQKAAIGARSERMMIRTAALQIIVKDFDAARAAVEVVVRNHGGHIGQLHTDTPRDAAQTLRATLRIPVDRLDAALTGLKQLGRVRDEKLAGEEVTDQYVDLVARLANARHTEQRLVEVLRQRTGKVTDVLEVEQEIARVREEIERMEAQRRNLEQRVALATVDLRLVEEYAAALQLPPDSAWTRTKNAAILGWQSAVDQLFGLSLLILHAGPTLLLWGAVLFWPLRWMWRRMRVTAAN